MSVIGQRFKNAWHAFKGRDPTYNMILPDNIERPYGYGSYYPFDRFDLSVTSSITDTVKMVYNQIAVDCSMIDILHVKLNEDGNYSETIDDELNRVLTKEANKDQTGRAMIRDTVFTMLSGGVVCIVPTVTDKDPRLTDSYKVEEVRVATIDRWYPDTVSINIFDDVIGRNRKMVVPKSLVAIAENPFYYIMNEQNSIAQRLSRILAQIDSINKKTVKPPLDLVFQVPYSTDSPRKQNLAERRRKELEEQLEGSSSGVAWIDGTEKITQLNRPVENNLWQQAQDLRSQLYNQLGFSDSIFNGTADEKTMLNYYNRSIAPILSEIVENMERKWLSRTAITQKQAIRYFRNPFKLVPVEELAEISDSLRRNVVVTANEIRSVMGLKPSKEEIADQLINSNISQPVEEKQSDSGDGNNQF